jgi:hypothetical protein
MMSFTRKGEQAHLHDAIPLKLLSGFARRQERVPTHRLPHHLHFEHGSQIHNKGLRGSITVNALVIHNVRTTMGRCTSFISKHPFLLVNVKSVQRKKVLHVQMPKLRSSDIHIQLRVVAGYHHPNYAVPENRNVAIIKLSLNLLPKPIPRCNIPCITEPVLFETEPPFLTIAMTIAIQARDAHVGEFPARVGEVP